MDKLLYWESCDEKITNKSLTGKEYEVHITRRLMSDSPDVDKVWFTASSSVNPVDTYQIHLHIIMKDGRRGEFRVTEDQHDNLQIPEAIEFLKTKNT